MQLKNLKPNEKNPRKISAKQREMLAKALEEFGDLSGFVFNRRTKRLAGGHQRQTVMPPDCEITIEKKYSKPTRAGTVAIGFVEWKGERYTYREVDVDASTEIAMNLAANKHGGEFDLNLLNDTLLQLDAVHFDLDLTGFDRSEIASLNKSKAKAGEDDVPEPRPRGESKTKLGQVFILGNHRLMCGDSTKPEDVQKLMAGQRAVLMVTDPPYGVKLDQSWRDKALGDKALGKGNVNVVKNDDRADWCEVWSIAPVSIAYIWHASSFTDVVMDSLRRAEFDIRQQIIWNKSVMVMGRSHYHFKHEPCWYAVRSGETAGWVGDRKQTTVWEAAAPNHIMSGSKEDKTEHPTQKPVALYDIPIGNHTKPGDLLYEPFGGSGTAIVAAEKNDRRCFTMELDPLYCDVIVARWEKFTGKKAKLISPVKTILRKS